MGLLEKIFIVINLIMAVGICVALGSTMGYVIEQEGKADAAVKAETVAVAQNKETRKKLGLSEKALNESEGGRTKAEKNNVIQSAQVTKQNALITKMKAKHQAKVSVLERDLATEQGKVTQLEKANDSMTDKLAGADAKRAAAENRETAKNDAAQKALEELKASNKTKTDKLEVKVLALQKIIDDMEPPELRKEKIYGKVVHVTGLDETTGDRVLITVETRAGSPEARPGLWFHIYRPATTQYLGRGLVVDQPRPMEDGGQMFVLEVREPVVDDEKAGLEVGDEIGTFIREAGE